MRLSAAQQAPVWLLLPAVGLIGGLLTGLLVQTFAPETSGTGIPQVKAALGGARISLSFRVALVKLVTTMLTVGSGLTLGRQGPTVQIGASLAAWIGNWIPTSPNYRRQLIACGAAAGLAAGFNAPIAGVLFVVEELLHDISGVTLGPAIVASFVGAVVSQWFGGQGVNLQAETSQIVDTLTPSFLSLKEIPFYLVLGALAGVGGTLFGRAIVAVSIFYQRQWRVALPFRIAIAGLISGLAVAFLPADFRNNAGLRDFLGSGSASLTATAIALVAHFVLTIIAAGSAAPGGLFAPSLILGSALGHLVGLSYSSIIGVDESATYALTGMGAFFCAVSRAPMTAVVIVFEIVSDFNLILPLMIGSIVAYLTAEKIDKKSLSDRLWELKGVRLKKQQAVGDSLIDIRATDVMVRQVETLEAELSLAEVKQAFSNSHHRGFPVLDKNGKLVGIVSQSDLFDTDKRNFSEDTPLSEFMTRQPVSVSPIDNLSEVLYQLNRYKLSRLPVIENRKLVGIITRSDIIRAESKELTMEGESGSSIVGSYVVYETRGPAVGSGRLLVPLSNPKTAPVLLNFAVAIAKSRNYEIECLQVILVPPHIFPSETEVNTTKSRRLLRKAEQIAQKAGVSIHTQIRVARDISGAILDTIKERHIALLLMGWKGDTSASGRIFGNVVDTLIRQAPCELVVVKWGNVSRDEMSFSQENTDYELLDFAWRRWLVPIRGELKQAAAIKLLPALVSLSPQPEIQLCQVFGKSVVKLDTEAIELGAKILSRRIGTDVITTLVCSNSVPEAIIDLVSKNQCDVVVVGATREGFLTQVINGNIPEAIARGCHCTVILVRSVN
jgi:CIC family chloride channel protein